MDEKVEAGEALSRMAESVFCGTHFAAASKFPPQLQILVYRRDGKVRRSPADNRKILSRLHVAGNIIIIHDLGIAIDEQQKRELSLLYQQVAYTRTADITAQADDCHTAQRRYMRQIVLVLYGRGVVGNEDFERWEREALQPQSRDQLRDRMIVNRNEYREHCRLVFSAHDLVGERLHLTFEALFVYVVDMPVIHYDTAVDHHRLHVVALHTIHDLRIDIIHRH